MRASGGYIWNTPVETSPARYSISGGSPAHFAPHVNGVCYGIGTAVTITGRPAFSTAFATWHYEGMLEVGGTVYDGFATGRRFIGGPEGSADTYGIDYNAFFPGNLAGTLNAAPVQLAGATSYYSVWSQKAIADDSAASFDLSAIAGGIAMILINSISGARSAVPRGQFAARVGAPYIENGTLDLTGVTLTTGELTGTTGVDGKFTIAAHTNGRLYFENRTGATRIITLLLVL